MMTRETIDLDLQEYQSKIQRHWRPALGIFLLTVASAVVATRFLTPVYEAAGKLRFKVDSSASFTSNDNTEELRPLVSTQNPLSTEVEVLYAKPLLQEVIQTLNLTNENQAPLTPKALSNNLEVGIIGGTDILKLTYTSKKADTSAQVVNTLMQQYIERDIEARQEQAAKAKAFFTEQIPQTEKGVRQAEEALNQFQEKHQIVDLETEIGTVVAEIAQLDREITQAQSNLDQARARQVTLREQVGLNPQDAAVVNTISQSSELKETLRQLQDAERQLAAEQTVFNDNFPSIVALKDRRDTLKRRLLEKAQVALNRPLDRLPTVLVDVSDSDFRQKAIQSLLDAQVESDAISQQLQTLSRRRATFEQRAQTLPTLRQTFRELTRQLQAAQSTYETLLNKVQELQVEQNVNRSNAQIIEPAIAPLEPSLGRKKLALIGGGVLLGSVFAATTISLLGRKKPEPQLQQLPEKIFDYPYWGDVSYEDPQAYSSFQGYKNQAADVSAMHRILQNQQQVFSKEHALRTIIVTSVEFQADKSRVAANFAIAMAQLGKKVLLIDSDIYSPSQHQIHGLNNKTLGLTNIIEDESIRFDEVKMVIDSTMANLDILTAGFSALNPTQLLNSPRMEQLLEDMTWHYDLVVVDAPPLLDVGVARLGRLADGVLLVTDSQPMDLEVASEVREMVDQCQQNIIGMVVSRGSDIDAPSSSSAPLQILNKFNI